MIAVASHRRLHFHRLLMANRRGRKLSPSYTNKVLIGLVFVILLALQFTFMMKTKTSTTIPNHIQSPDTYTQECQSSTFESDGWFCESDSDWKIRKAIDQAQHERNRISDDRSMFFQNNWEPTVHCSFERRVGNPGDGGKWICDIHRFRDLVDPQLLVYSFGSNNDFSFEQALKKRLPTAEIHTFDVGVFECPDEVCTYHRARIGSGKDHRSKSLQMIMKKLGHQGRDIHILKVDIEGSEFDLFEEMFHQSTQNRNLPYIRQILFEIHLGEEYDEEAVPRVHRLFELFRKNNYAIFHKEPNLYDPTKACEYSMIRLNPAFFK